jgi:hypothetical protein
MQIYDENATPVIRRSPIPALILGGLGMGLIGVLVYINRPQRFRRSSKR